MTISKNAVTNPQTADLLAAHHRELDERMEKLVAQAREDDPQALRAEWAAFERELQRHMELEEAELLPGFARQDAAAARAILAEHAQIRSDLLELGLTLDLHFLRAEMVDAFVRRLRAHAEREDVALYRWAERHTTPGAWDSIRRGLKDAAEGRLAAHFASRIM